MKKQGLFSYLVSRVELRIITAVLVAQPAMLVTYVALSRNGHEALCNNGYFHLILMTTFSFIFYKGITEYMHEQELKEYMREQEKNGGK